MTAAGGRVVLVTGGGRGIGRAVALAFAARGERVGRSLLPAPSTWV